jgi:DNA invertase Pin-like site-specific DNA recombinase
MPDFRPKQRNEDDENIWNIRLPLDIFWGVYARQSTPAQLINNVESTEMQTDDLIQWLVVRGVTDERIALFDADLGVSGTKRIDERTGLQELVEKIKQGIIKAVLVYQISRLFRDETGVQYNVFADVCKQHNCLLVTSDGMIFNFRNPMHLKMFRFLAEMAAEYIPQHIRLLHQARERKARKGVYAGMGTIPKGFIVDCNEKSKTYDKYIPYVPYAKVILSLFRRFYELDGNFSRLCAELKMKTVVFPPFDENVSRKNNGLKRWKKVDGGYHISRNGLITLLTNPVYIGWWIVRGDVVSRDNHERIIPKEEEYLFWFAFDLLAEFTTSGEINHKRTAPKRFYQHKTHPKAGLLKDRISGIDCAVYVHTRQDTPLYSVKNAKALIDRKFTTNINVEIIDKPFLKRFFEHLRSTHDFDNYHQYIKGIVTQKESTTTLLNSQLQNVEKQQSEIVDELLSIRRDIAKQVAEIVEADPTLDADAVKQKLDDEYAPVVRDLRKRSGALETIKKEVQTKLNSMEGERKIPVLPLYEDFHTELEKLVTVWDQKPFRDRQDFVNLFVSKAILSEVAPHWVKLEIDWSLPGWESEVLFIYRSKGHLTIWKQDERRFVKEYYPNGDRKELMSLLPDKTWGSIKNEAARQKLHRMANQAIDFFMPRETTWIDYQFAKTMGIEVGARDTICDHRY